MLLVLGLPCCGTCSRFRRFRARTSARRFSPASSPARRRCALLLIVSGMRSRPQSPRRGLPWSARRGTQARSWRSSFDRSRTSCSPTPVGFLIIAPIGCSRCSSRSASDADRGSSQSSAPRHLVRVLQMLRVPLPWGVLQRSRFDIAIPARARRRDAARGDHACVCAVPKSTQCTTSSSRSRWCSTLQPVGDVRRIVCSACSSARCRG